MKREVQRRRKEGGGTRRRSSGSYTKKVIQCGILNNVDLLSYAWSIYDIYGNYFITLIYNDSLINLFSIILKLNSIDYFVIQSQAKYTLFDVVLKCELECTTLNHIFDVEKITRVNNKIYVE